MKALLLTACGAGQFREISSVQDEIKCSIKNDFILVHDNVVAQGVEAEYRTFKHFTTIEDPKNFDRLAIYKEVM